MRSEGAMLQQIKDLGPMKLGIIGGVAALMLGFFTFLGMRGSSTGPMELLYSNLKPEESSGIVTYLEQNQIPYELRAGGTQIFVPDTKVDRTRVQLAGQGMPNANSGVGFEIFDKNEALGTSQFVNNVNYMRALEGELARSIATLDPISEARVHVVIPKRELFSRNMQPPTASVVVTMKNGKTLAKQEIQSIRHLVSTAVPGLELNRITLVDNTGKLLARGALDENDIGEAASEADEYRVRYEQRMKKQIEELLEQTVGLGNVKANVTADIDFDRIVKKSENFNPDGQVARSTQTIDEKEQSKEKSQDTNVTVKNNLPDPNPENAGLVTENQKSKSDETINYEISKEEINQVQEIGTVQKISVAVLVNGTMKASEDGAAMKYVERSPEELEQIGKLVKSAIGFDADRGDMVQVVNMPFSGSLDDMKPPSSLDWLKDDFHNILQTAILGIVAILAILLVIRPLVNRAIETTTFTEEEPEDVNALLPSNQVAGQLTDQRGVPIGPDGQPMNDMLEDDTLVSIMGIEGGIKSSSMRRVTALIDKNPEEALNVLRGWLTNDK
ncbi:flagellar M-ring protein FliF [bacterium]|nr:flagellar M-ring protein FliF [bacterium]